MNRRMMMAANTKSAPRLPSEYQEVEWIRTTGDNRIILPNASFRGNAVIRCRYYKDSQASNEQALVMARSGNNTSFEVGFSSTKNRIFAYSYGGTSASVIDPIVNQNWVDLEAVYSTSEPTKSLSVTANGTTKTASGAGTNYVAENIGIAIFNSPDAIMLSCYIRLAYMQIFLDGNEKYHLIPCYRKADGKISMYDFVTKTFFTPYSWANFSKGADVN